jgi:hypothetical protein
MKEGGYGARCGEVLKFHPAVVPQPMEGLQLLYNCTIAILILIEYVYLVSLLRDTPVPQV